MSFLQPQQYNVCGTVPSYEVPSKLYWLDCGLFGIEPFAVKIEK